MQPQDPRPGQDPPTEEHATGAWQEPPAQPSPGQPQQPSQPGWQQPPAQPSWGQPQQPPQGGWPGQQPPQGAWQQPAQQGWQQPPAQPSWGQQPAAGWGDPAAQFVGERSTAVTIAGILLLLISLFPLLVAAVILLLGNSAELIDQIVAQLNSSNVEVTRQAIRDVLVVVGIILGGFGLLGVIGGLGMALRRTWGRVFGFLVGLLGTLFGILALLGAVAGRGTSGQGSSLVVAIVIFVCYGFAFLETLLGGKHFQRG